MHFPGRHLTTSRPSTTEFISPPGGLTPPTLADTVRAGDAFTAALALGVLQNLPLKQINQDANRLASHVCTHPGATPPISKDLLDQLQVARASRP
jgi:sugar/nucleoside kinase (ribokinase family)